ncbi:MAG: efflux RND transporter periplasmic adaptor subunit [Planctomycetota bacterium]
MKIVLIVVGVVAVLLVVGTIIVVGAAPEGLLDAFTSEPPRTEIRCAPAEQKPLIETVSAPGVIEPLTMVEISAEVAARIEQLPLREGDEVRRDDVIVKLDDVDLKAYLNATKARRDGEQFRLQSEQARLAGLRQTLAFARKTMERQSALYETGDVSRSTLDDAMERVEDLEAGIEASTHTISVIESSLAAAEADIDRAEDDLTNAVIRSPIDGVVTLLNAEVGEVVLMGTMNNPGTVIMIIADLTRMILNARVAETDIASVEEGQKAKIFINAYPDEVFHGVVRKIAMQRTIELDGTGYFETEIELQLAAGRVIYSGLVANVDIEVAEHQGVLVESQAIVERLVDDLPSDIRRHPLINRAKRTTSVVYRVIDDKAVCTPVKVGAADLTHSIVREGLEEGEEVVVGPFKVLERIKHDELVRREGEAEEETEEAEGAPAEEAATEQEGVAEVAAEEGEEEAPTPE